MMLLLPHNYTEGIDRGITMDPWQLHSVTYSYASQHTRYMVPWLAGQWLGGSQARPVHGHTSCPCIYIILLSRCLRLYCCHSLGVTAMLSSSIVYGVILAVHPLGTSYINYAIWLGIFMVPSSIEYYYHSWLEGLAISLLLRAYLYELVNCDMFLLKSIYM